MSAKASKKSSEGSRKKKLREESETEETKKPKKSKTNKKEKHDEFDGMEEVGAKSIKEEAPRSSGKAANDEQDKEQSKFLLIASKHLP